MDVKLFDTQKNKLLQTYEEAGQPFRASTLPYHAVRSLRGEVREVDTVNGIAYLVFPTNQVLDFFSYGVGERIPLGPNPNFQATEAETNLAKGKSTNGAADFVIEGVGMSCRALTIQYAAPDAIDAGVPVGGDPDVVAAMLGQAPIIDPASIIMVPQGQSPFNLENALFNAISPFLSLEFEWDRKRTEKIGVCDLLPQAGGASYLRTNGEPASDNRYLIPEGYLWRRDGEPDGEFMARVVLERAVVCPINLRQTVGGSTYVAPTHVYLELLMRLYGLEVSLPSAN